MTAVLDHGYCRYVGHWGSDEAIIEAARMSTDGAFRGWGTAADGKPGDERLLAYLWKHGHMTPFEMAGLTVEVQAPIMVFREWHRHRTQCLGADTLVYFDAPKSRVNRRYVYKLRIEDLWKKFQPSVSKRPDKQGYQYHRRDRCKAMQLRCLNEETGEIVHTHIVDVIRGQPKRMYRVTTSSGKSIVASADHKFFTDAGWRRLQDVLHVRHRVICQSTARNREKRFERPPVDENTEVWRPISDWPMYEVSSEGRVRRQGKAPKKTTTGKHDYEVVSLNRPGCQVTVCVHVLVLEAFRGPKAGQEARHLNNNRADNRLCNLAWGTSADNSADMVKSDRQQRLVSAPEDIVDVQDLGVQETYDLSVEGPWHNFVAEGFVVHNSYNELSARYTEIPELFYVPSTERLLTGGQGKSNKQSSGTVLDEEIVTWATNVIDAQSREAFMQYRELLARGVARELARLVLPVNTYSRMRASANLRNWLGFLALRLDPASQFEIRQYAAVIAEEIRQRFPRTAELAIQT